MRLSAFLPPGVEALFFESARKRREIERRLVDELLAREYSEVILPAVDYLDPYEPLLKGADRTELYRLIDRDGAMLALRSDFTPMIARLLAPRIESLPKPLKLFYCGDVFRYQEERAGIQREFYQVGAEVLSEPGEESGEWAEQEALETFLELLEIGERHTKLVVLGVAGLLDPLLRASAGDGDPTELSRAVVRREHHVARGTHPALDEVIREGLPRDLESLGGAREAARLERLVALRDQLAKKFPDIDLRIDLAEFADLSPVLHQNDEMRSYYDGLVFRAFVGRAARPLGGGGRYDRMFVDGLGLPLTACGFSIKIDLLLHRGGGVMAGGNGDR